MATVKVGKWGNSLAFRVPLAVAREIGLREGESVEIEENHGKLRIRRTYPKIAN